MSNNYCKSYQFRINNTSHSHIYEEQKVCRFIKTRANFVSFCSCSLKEQNCITDLLCSNRTVIEDVMIIMYEELPSSTITVDIKVSN